MNRRDFLLSTTALAATAVLPAVAGATASVKFGATSLLLDGTGDYLTIADSADWTLAA